MPLFNFRCVDCELPVELLLSAGAPVPQRCGYRCVAPPGHGARGIGEIQRQVSAPNVVRAAVANDAPTTGDLQKRGFTAYENQGDGTFKKVGRGQGPDVVDANGKPR